jgi:hypothetical protein
VCRAGQFAHQRSDVGGADPASASPRLRGFSRRAPSGAGSGSGSSPAGAGSFGQLGPGSGLGLRLGLRAPATAVPVRACRADAEPPMTASGAPTSAVSSSRRGSAVSTRHTGEGISVSTLSVETSSSGSSTATSSPTFLSQRVTVPSVTDSPSAGMTDRLATAAWMAGGSLRDARAGSARPSHARGRAAGVGASGRVGAGSQPGLARLLGGAAAPRGQHPTRPVTDDGQVGADLGGLVLLGRGSPPAACRRRGGDLGVDLVGRHLEQRLVDGDRVADLLEPAGDRPLGDGLTQGRHGHAMDICVISSSMSFVSSWRCCGWGTWSRLRRGRAGLCRRAPGAPRREPRSGSGGRASAARRPRGGLPADDELCLADLLTHPVTDHMDTDDRPSGARRA